MTRQKVQDQQVSFAGGLNTTGDPAFLRPDQARQLTNYRLSPYGAATKRGGTRKLNSAAMGVAGIGPGYYWPLQGQYLQLQNGRLYTASQPGVFSANWTLTFTNQGAATNSWITVFTDASAVQVAFLAGAGVTLKKWDGTTLTTIASAAQCTGVVPYNSRLWGWNTTTARNSIFYSALNNGETLGIASSGGGQIVVDTFGTSLIMRCLVIGASLMIFHQRGISRLTGFGQDDIAVVPQAVSSDISIVSPHGAAVFEGVGYVATYAGLCRVTEGDAQLVGTPDRPDPTVAALAATSSATSTAVLVNRVTREVWVFIPGTGIYVYNLQLGSWSGPWNGSQNADSSATNLVEINDNTLLSRFVMSGNSSGFVYELDSPTYYKDGVNTDGTGGAAYTATLQPHRMYGQGDRSVAKAWRWVNVVATLDSAGTAPVMTSTTQIGSSNVQTFSTLTSVQTPYYCQGSGVGPWIDVVIADTSATASQYEHVDVDGFILGQR